MNPNTTLPPTPLPTTVAEVDPDLAEQARPGHGIPSQDPSPGAQFRLAPQDAEREAQSVLVGGGVIAGAAAGAAVGVMLVGPVGVLIGSTVGAVAGAMGGALGGALGDGAAGALADPPRSGGTPTARADADSRPLDDDRHRELGAPVLPLADPGR